MSKRKHYRKGDHWVHCQRCASVERSSDVRREWTGLIVCNECWEPRHPQDFVRARPEDTSAKGLVSPEPADTFIGPSPCAESAVVGKVCALTPIPESTFNGNTL